MKFHHRVLAVCAAAAALTVTSSLWAQNSETPKKKSIMSFDTMVDAFRNADGVIDVSNLPEIFMPERVVDAIKAADKNKDRLIDAEEEKVLRAAFNKDSKDKGSNVENADKQTRSETSKADAENVRGEKTSSADSNNARVNAGDASTQSNAQGGFGGGLGGGLDVLDGYRDDEGRINLKKAAQELPSGFVDKIGAADQNKDGLIDADEEKAMKAGFAARRGAGNRNAQNAQNAASVEKKRGAASIETSGDLEALRKEMIEDGVRFLTRSQSENGSFSASPRVGIGPTIIDAIGLLRVGVKLDDPVLANAMKFLEGAVHEDGGIYSEGMRLSTYESCLGLVCFMLANQQAGDGRYGEIVQNAEKFVRGSQYNEENGVSPEDEYFGGVGYGADSATRPDLSNTQFFIEALREIGAGEEDQAIQDALVFVSRCQNLESEDNAGGQAKTNDGGFIYTFVSGQENPAGQEVSGGLRSYGSITYAGLKSLIYAGLKADDPRVEAATNWIKENYTMTENPGLGKRGLYYYYHTLSKCFNVIGEETFTDSKGDEHDWRKELIQTLAAAENKDGSWANVDRMWYETDANLVTGYVLIVLSYCAKEREE